MFSWLKIGIAQAGQNPGAQADGSFYGAQRKVRERFRKRKRLRKREDMEEEETRETQEEAGTKERETRRPQEEKMGEDRV